MLAFMFATAGILRADIVETDTTPSSNWNGFSSVAAPSSSDLGQNAFVTLEVGGPNSSASDIIPDLLTDGLVATSNDPFATSSDSNLNRVFIGAESGNADYRLMIDLFGIYDTSTINVNSWHLGGHIDPNF